MKKKMMAVLCCILIVCTIGTACAKTCPHNNHPGVRNGTIKEKATCTKGTLYVGHCTACDEPYARVRDNELIPHKWEITKCQTEKRCSYNCGTKGEFVDHTWVGATCREKKHCIRYPNKCSTGKPTGGFNPKSHKNVDMATGLCRDCGGKAF